MRSLISGKTRLLLVALAGAGLTLGPFKPVSGGDASVETAEVGERIKALWKPFETVQFRSEEIIRINDSPTITVVGDFAWDQTTGRSAMIVDREEAGVISRGHDHREDATKLVQVIFFGNSRTEIDRITIGKTENRPGSYRNSLSHPVWLLMPGGRTVDRWIAEGSTLAWEGTGPGRRLILAFRVRDKDVRCELDLEHDGLPRSITYRDVRTTVELHADRYERVNGFWFPVEGSGSSTYPSGRPEKPRTFQIRLSGVAINQPIAASRFIPPAASKGVLVDDQRTGKRTTLGGRLARIERREKFAPRPEPTPPLPPPPAIKASVSPHRFPIATLLIGIAVVSGTAGLWLRYCR